ncbi:lysophospholipid acyltransferase family protein [Hydrogenophilus thermoluteolus]|uniref:Lipid A biosynthesis acyltransferase n=1 Tax=Hydrogenophilus thermoluteolus TaxID=297 RepID=A0A2Z6DZZ4_HYDTE|nr:lysophospholipid acyltransferase family protein [Hydrogenophilus thermoluteolus]HCO77009.1 lipid A biosynthesis acyltransferase [Rhodocyclaceae bacterium]MBW7656247.1 lysophospholipid acyltransferase family protein [Hydrogenophilus thermoluteolus]BBD78101.1 lipid A biosynthesis acyltransferase [Hydrogenophilus thermoluteolus]GLW60229.1 acyltransferase [Hydrogenophilus thermoluteolus]HNQ49782.1 lysophospholipid acyltransferase family protein [Hydrogenophilus thermoluteolus]
MGKRLRWHKDSPLRLWALRQADRAVVAFIWALHWLPLPVLAKVGARFGTLLRLLAKRRRRIAEVNLARCFPEWTDDARARLLREHFHFLGRSLLERGIAWFASPERIRRLVRLEGWAEHVAPLIAAGQPVILVTPHFLGLDLVGTRLTLEGDFVSVYSRQRRRPVADRWLRHGRSRFGQQLLIARQDGIRPVVRALKAGQPFYYLPDLDYGGKDAIFVPFFGVPAATITALPRLARLANAAVVLCIAEMDPSGRGYRARFSLPWRDYPTDDERADVERMNREIEAAVCRLPAQYFWVHRRFKTQPEGKGEWYR